MAAPGRADRQRPEIGVIYQPLIFYIAIFRTGRSTITAPRTFPAAEHRIDRAQIDPNALKVVQGLKQAGYQAYLVGGCVRDLLLGREPKDFDVVTDARPEQIKDVFPRCRLIGRRFQLVHVHFGRDYIEVATFRARHQGDEEGGEMRDGRIVRDNVFGTPEEDAWRRDFTVNALYYSPDTAEVVDFVDGFADQRAGVLRVIGDPATRYREDPVRMLRAARFAAKTGFRIHPDSEAPIFELAPLLQQIPPARLFEEVLKLFLGGCALQTFEVLRHYRLFGELFPQTEQALSHEKDGFPQQMLIRALANTDQRIAADKPVTPAFLAAALLWSPMLEIKARLEAEGMPDIQAWQQAANIVLDEQIHRVSIPKRFSSQVREIWGLQSRLERRSGKRPLLLLTHVRFRAAYDFLLLRAEAGEALQELCDWWTRFQQVDEDERQAMCEPEKNRPRRRRRRSKKSSVPGP